MGAGKCVEGVSVVGRVCVGSASGEGREWDGVEVGLCFVRYMSVTAVGGVRGVTARCT